jgi:hypothetical protein
LSPFVGTAIAPGVTTGTIALTILGGGPINFSFVPRVEQAIEVPDIAVSINDPATLITVGSTPLQVSGTVTPADATLTVNGAQVAHSNGQFSAAVALEEGSNTIVARVVGANGGEVTDSIVVSMDLTPPYITVETPEDGQVINTNTIAVSGLVNDIVRGTIADNQANVTVNGIAASVSNRSYLAENVPLQEGDNQIIISASDQVGNSATQTLTVRFEVPGAKRIEMVSGQNQKAQIQNTIAAPLVVQLIGSDGNPVAGKNVVFRVIQGDGVVGVGTVDESQAVLVTSDDAGQAQTSFKLGSRSGNGNHRVRAKAVGFDGEVVFYASADPNPGDKISVIAGNNQRGAVNQPLPEPFVVAVTDTGSNLIAGTQVQFDVVKGGGRFQDGSTAFTTTTDTDGRASAQLTLGPDAGLDQQQVTATLVGTTAKAGFTASALQAGDPGQTTVTGVVLDNQDNPVPGVTIRVDGTTRQGVADAQGQFTITEVPVGPVHLLADGSTASVPGEWPTLSYNIVTVSGANNPLSAPIYMVKLNTERAQWVGSENVEFLVPEIPGFKLKVQAGSVTFPDGAKEGLLSVTPVNANKIPMAPPNGMQPQLIVTIQPTGTKFDPPAALSLPNVDAYAPGAQVEMYSYDHDLEEFVTIGLGTVSADGSVVASNNGVGVIKAGWHCGSSPSGSGCANGCGYCYDCGENCSCNFVPTRVAQNQSPTDCRTTKCDGSWDPANETPSTPDTPKDCQKPACENGSPTQIADAGDKPDDTPNDCKKPVCNGTTPGTEPDPNDLPDNDQPNDCKKPACDGENPSTEPDTSDIPTNECEKCSVDGDVVPDDDKECEDGKYCTSADGLNPGPDKCEGGVCEGQELTFPKDFSAGQEYDFTKLKQLLDGATLATKFVPGCTAGGAPSVTGAVSIATTKSCCESESRIADATQLSGEVTVIIPAFTCRLPVFSFGLATLTANVGLAGSGKVTGTGIKDDCDGNCGYNISGSVNATLSGGIGVNIISPDVIEVTGGIRGSGTFNVGGGCGDISVSGCVGPPNVYGTVTLGGWITKEVSTDAYDSLIACF